MHGNVKTGDGWGGPSSLNTNKLVNVEKAKCQFFKNYSHLAFTLSYGLVFLTRYLLPHLNSLVFAVILLSNKTIYLMYLFVHLC